MKKLAKTLLVGALLVGGTLPTLPFISGDAHAAPSVAQAAKAKTYQHGYFYVVKDKPASTGQFSLKSKAPIKITFTATANKKANYIFELVKLGAGPGSGIKSSFKGSTSNKKITKTLAGNAASGKYFVRVHNLTAKSTMKVDFNIHN